MKLNKRMLLLIGAAIFVIAVAALVRTISQKLDEQKKVEKQLATAQTRLQGLQLEPLNAQQAQLEEQLKQVTPQRESAIAIISQNISSTGTASALFDAARANDLIVDEFTSSNLTGETFGGANLLSLTVNARVSGNITDISGFVSDLNRAFITGAVRSVSVMVPAGSTSANASANINLVIYTYRGD